MVEVGRDSDLAQEPLGAECASHLAAKHLDGDIATVTQVCCQIHGRHATGTDLADDAVAVRERRADVP